MFKSQKFEGLERKLKQPNQTTRFMIKCGWVQKHIGKQLNVNVRTPQTKKVSEKSVFPPVHIKFLFFKTLILIKCLWLEPKTAKRFKCELN